MNKIARTCKFIQHQSNKLDGWSDRSFLNMTVTVVIGLSAIYIVIGVGLGIYAHVMLK